MKMRKISIILTCIFIHASILSQEYFPQSTIWKYKEYSYYTDKTYFYQSYIDGDSIIDDVEYKVLHSYELGSVAGKEQIVKSLVPIRESQGKIYCRVKRNGYGEYEEILLYDFTVSIGDTVKRSYYDSYSEEDNIAIVTSIEEVTLNDGTIAKKINYDKRNSDIEYVGSTSGFLYPLYGGLSPIGFQMSFLCCMHGDVIIYGTEIKNTWTFPDKWNCINEQRWRGDNPDGPDVVELNMATYSLVGDTIINSLKYEKLYYDDSMQTELIGGLRFNSDASKVYFMPIADYNKSFGTEYLLFDYNIEPGDTLIAFCRGIDDWYIEDVQGVDSTAVQMVCMKIDNTGGYRYFRMRALLSLEYERTYDFTWIEGIGTMYGLFAHPHTFDLLNESYSDHPLLCATYDGEVLYQRDDKSLSHIGHNGIKNHCNFFEEIPKSQSSLTEIYRTDNVAPLKQLRDGRLIISLPDGREYDALGRPIRE